LRKFIQTLAVPYTCLLFIVIIFIELEKPYKAVWLFHWLVGCRYCHIYFKPT